MELPNQIVFAEDGLLPAIVQDSGSGEILMLAYMNCEALAKTLETGKSHFWSRSRKALWRKGETSGNEQQVKEIRLDCDGDALLLKVDQKGVACHTGARSCFYRKLEDGTVAAAEAQATFPLRDQSAILQRILEVIQDRKRHPKEGSYTCELFFAGQEKILKKVSEEASEVLIASIEEDRFQVIYEVADLLYHVLVLLGFHDIPLTTIYDELERRYGK